MSGLNLGKRGSFSRRLSERIDLLIEGQLARRFPKNFAIPGLDSDKDDGGKANLFGSDADDFEVMSMGSITAKSTKIK